MNVYSGRNDGGVGCRSVGCVTPVVVAVVVSLGLRRYSAVPIFASCYSQCWLGPYEKLLNCQTLRVWRGRNSSRTCSVFILVCGARVSMCTGVYVCVYVCVCLCM